jgi:protein TonB
MPKRILKDKTNIEHSDLDVLFAHRNKEYGAYFMRREYNRRLTIAFVSTCSFFILLLIIPFIIRWLRNDSLKNEDFDQVLVIEAPIPKGFVTPEYLPPPPPPEKKNTAPIVVKDSIPKEIKEEPKKPVLATPPLTDNKSSKDTLQNKPSTGVADGDPDQFSIDIDEYPSWASGDYLGFQDYIQKNIKMPEIDKVMQHYGTVIITATVNKDGTVTNVFVTKGLSGTLNAEALRVIKAMPKLNPAIYHRKPVKTYMKFPVTFLPANQVTGGK